MLKRGFITRSAVSVVLLCAMLLLLSIPGVTAEDSRRPLDSADAPVAAVVAGGGAGGGLLFSEWRDGVGDGDGDGAAADPLSGLSLGSFVVRGAGRQYVENVGARWRDVAGAAVDINRRAESLLGDARVRQYLLDSLSDDNFDLRNEFRGVLSEWRTDLSGVPLRLSDIAVDEALSLTESLGGRLKFIRTVELDLQTALGERPLQYGVNILGAFRESEKDAVAWQLRAFGGEDSRLGANAGLIYRRDYAGKLLGVNTFLDFEDNDYGDFWRWSLGAEARSAWLDVYGNSYFVLSKEQRTGDVVAYSQDGYDLEAVFHAPQYRWISGNIAYYSWQGEFGQDDTDGLRYGLAVGPFSGNSSLLGGVRLEVEYDSEFEDWGGRLTYTHEFGQAESGNVGGDESFTPSDYFFAPVRREYAQRIRTVQVAGAAVDAQITDLEGNGRAILIGAAATLAVTLTKTGENIVAEGNRGTLAIAITVAAYPLVFADALTLSTDDSVMATVRRGDENNRDWTVGWRQSTQASFSTDGSRLVLLTGTVAINRTRGLDEIVVARPERLTIVLRGTNLTVGTNGIRTTVDLSEGRIAYSFADGNTNLDVRVAAAGRVRAAVVGGDNDGAIFEVDCSAIENRYPESAKGTAGAYTNCGDDNNVQLVDNGVAVINGKITITRDGNDIEEAKVISNGKTVTVIWGRNEYRVPMGTQIMAETGEVTLFYDDGTQSETVQEGDEVRVDMVDGVPQVVGIGDDGEKILRFISQQNTTLTLTLVGRRVVQTPRLLLTLSNATVVVVNGGTDNNDIVNSAVTVQSGAVSYSFAEDDADVDVAVLPGASATATRNDNVVFSVNCNTLQNRYPDSAKDKAGAYTICGGDEIILHDLDNGEIFIHGGNRLRDAGNRRVSEAKTAPVVIAVEWAADEYRFPSDTRLRYENTVVGNAIVSITLNAQRMTIRHNETRIVRVEDDGRLTLISPLTGNDDLSIGVFVRTQATLEIDVDGGSGNYRYQLINVPGGLNPAARSGSFSDKFDFIFTPSALLTATVLIEIHDSGEEQANLLGAFTVTAGINVASPLRFVGRAGRVTVFTPTGTKTAIDSFIALTASGGFPNEIGSYIYGYVAGAFNPSTANTFFHQSNANANVTFHSFRFAAGNEFVNARTVSIALRVRDYGTPENNSATLTVVVISVPPLSADATLLTLETRTGVAGAAVQITINGGSGRFNYRITDNRAQLFRYRVDGRTVAGGADIAAGSPLPIVLNLPYASAAGADSNGILGSLVVAVTDNNAAEFGDAGATVTVAVAVREPLGFAEFSGLRVVNLLAAERFLNADPRTSLLTINAVGGKPRSSGQYTFRTTSIPADAIGQFNGINGTRIMRPAFQFQLLGAANSYFAEPRTVSIIVNLQDDSTPPQEETVTVVFVVRAPLLPSAQMVSVVAGERFSGELVIGGSGNYNLQVQSADPAVGLNRYQIGGATRRIGQSFSAATPVVFELTQPYGNADVVNAGGDGVLGEIVILATDDTFSSVPPTEIRAIIALRQRVGFAAPLENIIIAVAPQNDGFAAGVALHTVQAINGAPNNSGAYTYRYLNGDGAMLAAVDESVTAGALVIRAAAAAFASPGVFTVTIEVTDFADEFNKATLEVVITAVSAPLQMRAAGVFVLLGINGETAAQTVLTVSGGSGRYSFGLQSADDNVRAATHLRINGGTLGAGASNVAAATVNINTAYNDADFARADDDGVLGRVIFRVSDAVFAAADVPPILITLRVELSNPLFFSPSFITVYHPTFLLGGQGRQVLFTATVGSPNGRGRGEPNGRGRYKYSYESFSSDRVRFRDNRLGRQVVSDVFRAESVQAFFAPTRVTVKIAAEDYRGVNTNRNYQRATLTVLLAAFGELNFVNPPIFYLPFGKTFNYVLDGGVGGSGVFNLTITADNDLNIANYRFGGRQIASGGVIDISGSALPINLQTGYQVTVDGDIVVGINDQILSGREVGDGDSFSGQQVTLNISTAMDLSAVSLLTVETVVGAPVSLLLTVNGGTREYDFEVVSASGELDLGDWTATHNDGALRVGAVFGGVTASFGAVLTTGYSSQAVANVDADNVLGTVVIRAKNSGAAFFRFSTVLVTTVIKLRAQLAFAYSATTYYTNTGVGGGARVFDVAAASGGIPFAGEQYRYAVLSVSPESARANFGGIVASGAVTAERAAFESVAAPYSAPFTATVVYEARDRVDTAVQLTFVVNAVDPFVLESFLSVEVTIGEDSFQRQITLTGGSGRYNLTVAAADGAVEFGRFWRINGGRFTVGGGDFLAIDPLGAQDFELRQDDEYTAPVVGITLLGTVLVAVSDPLVTPPLPAMTATLVFYYSQVVDPIGFFNPPSQVSSFQVDTDFAGRTLAFLQTGGGLNIAYTLLSTAPPALASRFTVVESSGALQGVEVISIGDRFTVEVTVTLFIAAQDRNTAATVELQLNILRPQPLSFLPSEFAIDILTVGVLPPANVFFGGAAIVLQAVQGGDAEPFSYRVLVPGGEVPTAAFTVVTRTDTGGNLNVGLALARALTDAVVGEFTVLVAVEDNVSQGATLTASFVGVYEPLQIAVGRELNLLLNYADDGVELSISGGAENRYLITLLSAGAALTVSEHFGAGIENGRAGATLAVAVLSGYTVTAGGNFVLELTAAYSVVADVPADDSLGVMVFSVTDADAPSFSAEFTVQVNLRDEFAFRRDDRLPLTAVVEVVQGTSEEIVRLRGVRSDSGLFFYSYLSFNPPSATVNFDLTQADPGGRTDGFPFIPASGAIRFAVLQTITVVVAAEDLSSNRITLSLVFEVTPPPPFVQTRATPHYILPVGYQGKINSGFLEQIDIINPSQYVEGGVPSPIEIEELDDSGLGPVRTTRHGGNGDSSDPRFILEVNAGGGSAQVIAGQSPGNGPNAATVAMSFTFTLQLNQPDAVPGTVDPYDLIFTVSFVDKAAVYNIAPGDGGVVLETFDIYAIAERPIPPLSLFYGGGVNSALGVALGSDIYRTDGGELFDIIAPPGGVIPYDDCVAASGGGNNPGGRLVCSGGTFDSSLLADTDDNDILSTLVVQTKENYDYNLRGDLPLGFGTIRFTVRTLLRPQLQFANEVEVVVVENAGTDTASANLTRVLQAVGSQTITVHSDTYPDSIFFTARAIGGYASRGGEGETFTVREFIGFVSVGVRTVTLFSKVKNDGSGEVADIIGEETQTIFEPRYSDPVTLDTATVDAYRYSCTTQNENAFRIRFLGNLAPCDGETVILANVADIFPGGRALDAEIDDTSGLPDPISDNPGRPSILVPGILSQPGVVTAFITATDFVGETATLTLVMKIIAAEELVITDTTSPPPLTFAKSLQTLVLNAARGGAKTNIVQPETIITPITRQEARVDTTATSTVTVTISVPTGVVQTNTIGISRNGLQIAPSGGLPFGSSYRYICESVSTAPVDILTVNIVNGAPVTTVVRTAVDVDASSFDCGAQTGERTIKRFLEIIPNNDAVLATARKITLVYRIEDRDFVFVRDPQNSDGGQNVARAPSIVRITVVLDIQSNFRFDERAFPSYLDLRGLYDETFFPLAGRALLTLQVTAPVFEERVVVVTRQDEDNNDIIVTLTVEVPTDTSVDPDQVKYELAAVFEERIVVTQDKDGNNINVTANVATASGVTPQEYSGVLLQSNNGYVGWSPAGLLDDTRNAAGRFPSLPPPTSLIRATIIATFVGDGIYAGDRATAVIILDLRRIPLAIDSRVFADRSGALPAADGVRVLNLGERREDEFTDPSLEAQRILTISAFFAVGDVQYEVVSAAPRPTVSGRENTTPAQLFPLHIDGDNAYLGALANDETLYPDLPELFTVVVVATDERTRDSDPNNDADGRATLSFVLDFVLPPVFVEEVEEVVEVPATFNPDGSILEDGSSRLQKVLRPVTTARVNLRAQEVNSIRFPLRVIRGTPRVAPDFVQLVSVGVTVNVLTAAITLADGGLRPDGNVVPATTRTIHPAGTSLTVAIFEPRRVDGETDTYIYTCETDSRHDFAVLAPTGLFIDCIGTHSITTNILNLFPGDAAFRLLSPGPRTVTAIITAQDFSNPPRSAQFALIMQIAGEEAAPLRFKANLQTVTLEAGVHSGGEDALAGAGDFPDARGIAAVGGFQDAVGGVPFAAGAFNDPHSGQIITVEGGYVYTCESLSTADQIKARGQLSTADFLNCGGGESNSGAPGSQQQFRLIPANQNILAFAGAFTLVIRAVDRISDSAVSIRETDENGNSMEVPLPLPPGHVARTTLVVRVAPKFAFLTDNFPTYLDLRGLYGDTTFFPIASQALLTLQVRAHVLGEFTAETIDADTGVTDGDTDTAAGAIAGRVKYQLAAVFEERVEVVTQQDINGNDIVINSTVQVAIASGVTPPQYSGVLLQPNSGYVGWSAVGLVIDGGARGERLPTPDTLIMATLIAEFIGDGVYAGSRATVVITLDLRHLPLILTSPVFADVDASAYEYPSPGLLGPSLSRNDGKIKRTNNGFFDPEIPDQRVLTLQLFNLRGDPSYSVAHMQALEDFGLQDPDDPNSVFFADTIKSTSCCRGFISDPVDIYIDPNDNSLAYLGGAFNNDTANNWSPANRVWLISMRVDDEIENDDGTKTVVAQATLGFIVDFRDPTAGVVLFSQRAPRIIRGPEVDLQSTLFLDAVNTPLAIFPSIEGGIAQAGLLNDGTAAASFVCLPVASVTPPFTVQVQAGQTAESLRDNLFPFRNTRDDACGLGFNPAAIGAWSPEVRVFTLNLAAQFITRNDATPPNPDSVPPFPGSPATTNESPISHQVVIEFNPLPPPLPPPSGLSPLQLESPIFANLRSGEARITEHLFGQLLPENAPQTITILTLTLSNAAGNADYRVVTHPPAFASDDNNVATAMPFTLRTDPNDAAVVYVVANNPAGADKFIGGVLNLADFTGVISISIVAADRIGVNPFRQFVRETTFHAILDFSPPPLLLSSPNFADLEAGEYPATEHLWGDILNGRGPIFKHPNGFFDPSNAAMRLLTLQLTNLRGRPSYGLPHMQAIDRFGDEIDAAPGTFWQEVSKNASCCALANVIDIFRDPNDDSIGYLGGRIDNGDGTNWDPSAQVFLLSLRVDDEVGEEDDGTKIIGARTTLAFILDFSELGGRAIFSPRAPRVLRDIELRNFNANNSPLATFPLQPGVIGDIGITDDGEDLNKLVCLPVAEILPKFTVQLQTGQTAEGFRDSLFQIRNNTDRQGGTATVTCGLGFNPAALTNWAPGVLVFTLTIAANFEATSPASPPNPDTGFPGNPRATSINPIFHQVIVEFNPLPFARNSRQVPPIQAVIGNSGELFRITLADYVNGLRLEGDDERENDLSTQADGPGPDFPPIFSNSEAAYIGGSAFAPLVFTGAAAANIDSPQTIVLPLTIFYRKGDPSQETIVLPITVQFIAGFAFSPNTPRQRKLDYFILYTESAPMLTLSVADGQTPATATYAVQSVNPTEGFTNQNGVFSNSQRFTIAGGDKLIGQPFVIYGSGNSIPGNPGKVTLTIRATESVPPNRTAQIQIELDFSP